MLEVYVSMSDAMGGHRAFQKVALRVHIIVSSWYHCLQNSLFYNLAWFDMTSYAHGSHGETNLKIEFHAFYFS